MRATSRIADVSINTVSKLLDGAGEACAKHHHETVRSIQANRVQCDEIWSFTYAMVALYTTWYNFVRQQKTLRGAPVMAAGISDRL